MLTFFFLNIEVFFLNKLSLQFHPSLILIQLLYMPWSVYTHGATYPLTQIKLLITRGKLSHMNTFY